MPGDVAEILRFARSLSLSSNSIERLYACLLNAVEIERPCTQARSWPGQLISFDGHSGSGKDTQIDLLERHLADSSANRPAKNVVSVTLKRCDPFRSVVKSLWESMSADDRDCSFLLLSAGRKYVADAVVLPLLQDSETVVLQNRSYVSHVAYHAGDRGAEELLALCQFDPRADLSLVLYCETSLASERIKRRASDSRARIHLNETPEFVDRVKHHFDQLRETRNLVFIDTSADVESVARQIRRPVAGCLAD